MTTRQSALRSGTSIWLKDRRDSRPHYPRLRGHHAVEVAIVGGGITGALVAEAFARDGISVAILESELVGRGSTAASSALLLREPDLGLGELTERYGATAAVRIWQLCAAGVRDLVSTLRRRRIPCDLSTSDAIYLATTADAAKRLETEFRHRRAAGFGGRWLTPDALRRTTAIPAFGALRTTGHAQLNPYSACIGLLAAAARSGARIFEQSRVIAIRNVRDGVRLQTSSGTVDARRVIIATGYATGRFRPLAGRFTMYRTYVLATPPLSAPQRRRLGVGRALFWDTARPYHYARWTPAGRLLVGGADRRVVPGARRDSEFVKGTTELRKDFEGMLPGLDDVGFAAAWDGLFAVTPDGLPYIGAHRRYPRHLFALGYGGNGMTFGSLAARLLLEQWQGIHSSDHDLFAFGRVRARQARHRRRRGNRSA